MRGVETTCASKILRGFVPPYESTVTARLEAAGAVALGKLNMDEFAMGSSTENSSVKPTRNPWSPAHVPGGSSGGSAAAVAASLCAGATGTDTGGSIRQPAALCGVVGMKPTYGRVSRYGVIAFASSLDHPGPFGRTVEDAAALLEVMSGVDPLDATSIPAPVGAYRQAARAGREGLAGVRIGVPTEYFQPGMDAEIEAAVRAALDELARAGAKIVPVSLPHTKYAIATYYLICTAEASSNLARYDGVRYGLRAAGARARSRSSTRRRAARASARSPSGGSCSAPTSCARATTRPTTARRCGCAARSPTTSRRRSPRATSSSRRPRRCRRSSSASASATRCRCTWPTSSPSRRTWPASPRCRSRAASPRRGCRSACRSSARRWARRSASASAAPTNRAPTGTRAPIAFRVGGAELATQIART